MVGRSTSPYSFPVLLSLFLLEFVFDAVCSLCLLALGNLEKDTIFSPFLYKSPVILTSPFTSNSFDGFTKPIPTPIFVIVTFGDSSAILINKLS